MAHATELPITDDDAAAFAEDGAICIRNVLDDAAVDALREAVAWSMENPGPFALDFAKEESGSSFFGDVFVWTRNPAYRDLVVNARFGEIAGRLMGARDVRFYFDHLLVKEPGSGAPTPWHQDAPYWTIDGRQCCSIWIALDPVSPESGAVEYVRGSHAWGKYYAPESFKGDDRLKNEALDRLPDIDADRDRYETLGWELAPGDVVAHHCLTIHGAPANASTRRRRGLALRFIGDDVVYATRPGIPEPMTGSLAELAPWLEPGVPYSGEPFPVLWQDRSA